MNQTSRTELDLTARDRRMLELLATGADGARLAAKLGLTPGTVRVYLHFLYRKLGVRNRTEATLWYLRATGRQQEVRVPEAGEPLPPAEPARPLHGRFGETALDRGLLAALGVMETFLGPYGRVWEVAAIARGDGVAPNARIRASRRLWQALLQGDFSHAKRLHDQPDSADGVLLDDAEEGVLVTAMLWFGGFTEAARRAQRTLERRGRSAPLTRSQLALLAACRDFALGKPAEAALQRIATAQGSSEAVRSFAMVLLFHGHRLRRQWAAAVGTADAIWAAAEAARGDLEAMGFRPLDRQASLPASAKGTPAASRAPAPRRDRRVATTAGS